MQDKIYVLLTYALFGICLALWPVLAKEKFNFTKNERFEYLNKRCPKLGLKIIGGSLIVFFLVWVVGEAVAAAVPILICLASIAVISSISHRKIHKSICLAIFITLVISTTIPWWQRQNGLLEMTSIQILIFFLLTSAFIQLFSISNRVLEKNTFPIVWLAIFAIPAAILSFSTGILKDDIAWFTQWHHWSAYIASSELLLSGASIFYDFPVQYGLGPTALIASFCGGDCWRGMYFIVGSTTFIYSFLIVVLALTVSRNRWSDRLAVITLCFATCFFWTAYPPDVSSPVVTPSVSGLRFLPALLLTTYLFLSTKIENSIWKILIGHIFWAFGVLWSPESAFYVTLIWWPYYLFIRRSKADYKSRLKVFLHNSIRLLLTCVGFALIFNVIYLIIYKKLPTFYGFFAYVINPPGPMPINLHGGLWFFLLVIVIGVGNLLIEWRSIGDSILFRRSLISILLCYGVFSYFLGRSHDNNLLNILPFILLVLLTAVSNIHSKIISKMGSVLASTFIGWLVLFGWSALSVSLNTGSLLEFNSNYLLSSASLSNANTDSKVHNRFIKYKMTSGIPQDAGNAIEYLRQNYGEPFTVLDYSMILEHAQPPSTWSAIHDPANYVSIPSIRRQEFLIRMAQSYKKSGWLIVDRNFPAEDWLMDFDVAYDRTNRLEFGSYYAIRFSPKLGI